MVTRREFIKKGGLALMAAAIGGGPLRAAVEKAGGSISATDFISKRPVPGERNFTSKAVEKVIARVKGELKDQKLVWMFENCFPNTLDTTVDFQMRDGRPDTFVITGDITQCGSGIPVRRCGLTYLFARTMNSCAC